MKIRAFKLNGAVNKCVHRFYRWKPETIRINMHVMGELRQQNALHEPLQRLVGLLLKQIATNVHDHGY